MSLEKKSIIILLLFASLSSTASSDGPTTSFSPSDEPTTDVSPSDEPTTDVSPSDGPTTNVSPSDGPTTTVTVSPDSPESTCNKRSVSCGHCVEDKGCFYCWKNKSCHNYRFKIFDPVPETCPSLGDMSYMTCLVSEKSLWIMVGTGSAVLLTAILLVLYCCCCRKKRSTDRLIEEMAKSDARERTRRAELDGRRREREARMDQIRAKYGLKGSPFQ